ncbi:DUF4350 domain-containing protein [Mucilaginibacter sp. Bleaf8]|uniref:DUF4350 domain-containing protein n=1 Tax=Mucilaginibacter sp. Bleaf8 TaxID=2834430 RepID=UPI001BD06999|nr:DUF4350 domain-containing protein [Mucilaginibacter sp. Bleaf8]MBS7566077.1 DUF4350 domain-containing protein [Mucilaginibacter sp. Bleaf8]
MKDFKLLMLVCVGALVIYLVAQYNKPKPVNWISTLYYKDKIPFGTAILHQQLNQIFPGAAVTHTNSTLNKVFQDSSLSGNYMVVAKTIETDKYDYERLVKYIKVGNNVFMSAFVWQGFLADTLKLQMGSEYKQANAGLNFTNPRLKRPGYYTFKHDVSNQYFSSFDTAHAVVLSQNTLGHSNYLQFKFGKGNLYLCAGPHLFTNYSLLNPQGAEYAAKALSYLPVTKNIYWDQFQNKDIPQDTSPLRVIFGNESLSWAYYIALLTTLFFVLYQMKRRQRIIPVIEPLQNTTLEFVSVVGGVYYEQRNNFDITLKKITYLLEHIRSKYNLKTGLLNKDFVDGLTQKTGIDHELATELVYMLNYLHNHTQISDQELIKLNQLIEEFYAKSR